MKMNTYRVSEVFYSPQGEGQYTGHLTAWVRFFSCNLQCNGFGQKDPTNPDTYELPYKDFDTSKIHRLEDLPVWNKGCDSSYSWSAKFKHLCPELSAPLIADKILTMLPNKSFWNPKANNLIHLAFTGGEPLLPKGQEMISEVIDDLYTKGEFPEMVTIETNGTQILKNKKLLDIIHTYYLGGYSDNQIFLSISPKLFNVSGETRDKAIDEKAIKSYRGLPGQLKFVVDTKPETWKEMKEVIEIYRDNGCKHPVWVMPVGATEEQQRTKDVTEIAKKAMASGYNISARVHTYLFGNVIGS